MEICTCFSFCLSIFYFLDHLVQLLLVFQTLRLDKMRSCGIVMPSSNTILQRRPYCVSPGVISLYCHAPHHIIAGSQHDMP